MKKYLLLFVIILLGSSYSYGTSYQLISNTLGGTIYSSDGCTTTISSDTMGYTMRENCPSSITSSPSLSKWYYYTTTTDCGFPTDSVYQSCLNTVGESSRSKCISNITSTLSFINDSLKYSDMVTPLCLAQINSSKEFLEKLLSIVGGDIPDVGELSNAILWMYQNGLTMYNTMDKFLPYDYITREQASKFFAVFSKNILNKTVDTSKTASFYDLKYADPTLQSSIKEAYQLGLFQGYKGKFMPFNNLTQAQAIAVIMRSKHGYQDETNAKWYSAYYNLSNNEGILDGLGFNYDSLDSINITRGQVALLLYRLTDDTVSDDTTVNVGGTENIVYEYENGDKYVGEVVNGIKHGQGTFTWANGDKYVGQWENGNPHGQGTYTFADGRKYVGNFADGLRNGQGTNTYPNGDKYIGTWENDKINGQGTYTWADGETYIGQWVNGVKDGQGTMTYINGDKYVGYWLNDMFHGQGTFTFADGRKYVGNNAYGVRSGQGTMTFPTSIYDAISYVGQWENDKPNGQGTMTYVNGTKETGQWVNGEFMGY